MTDPAHYLSFIKRLLPGPPQSIDDASLQLGIEMQTVEKGTRIWGEARGETAFGPVFSNIELRFYPDGRASLLALTLPPDQAPNLDDVLGAFDGLKITATPRGRSDEEMTEFSRKEYWGPLTFGFLAHTPDKLASVVLGYTYID